MIQLAVDTPQFIVNMLSSVDYSKITDAQYTEWLLLIRNNIGKYLKLRKVAPCLMKLNYPIRQDLCDLINKYDFNSLSFTKQLLVVPLVNNWVNNNLPLKKVI